MVGCFGNYPVDRYLEDKLYQYLDAEDENADVDEDELFVCEKCGHICNIANVEYDDIKFYDICPKCKHEQAW